ncbi:hypothetical protein B7C62_18910 [Kitasatospora albolonga]|uniref:DUF5666 domain-containing protein n=1 Tax=Kitasatospora albolonga TaxID=68173 RepID=A0ABC8BW43_9ACTN|nr:hypothetical protein B7C62_18910 [Kitasatospora albolonga]
MSIITSARRVTAVAAVVVAALSGAVLTAPAAHAAPELHWNDSGMKNPDSRFLEMWHPGKHIGNIHWSADPIVASHLGDTLYVNDLASDGYSIRGQVKQVSTGEIIIDIGTAGKTAPAQVKKTKNLKEGTKVQIRGCVMKAGKSHGCTSWYSARA